MFSDNSMNIYGFLHLIYICYPSSRAFLSGKSFSMNTCRSSVWYFALPACLRQQCEIPETRTTLYMLKDLPERNALLAGYAYVSCGISIMSRCHIHLTIIPRARVGYEMIDSQRGAKRRAGYNHIQQVRVE